MDEYIKKEDAILAFDDDRVERYYGDVSPESVICVIENIPAADVKPVVRGEWVGYPECLKYTNAYSDDHIVCSVCEECFSILDNDCERFNFCPNCGADMRGKADV